MYDAKVIQVLIASPGDVEGEREAVKSVLLNWNAQHARERQAVLLPLTWESHAAPILAGRSQGIINELVVDYADILVGIFWTRLGTPTGQSKSGTFEEIQRHHAKGLPVMLYFSNKKADLSKVDPAQYALVQEAKAWAMGEGLIWTFKSTKDFEQKLANQISIVLASKYLLPNAFSSEPKVTFPPFALNLLDEAVRSNDDRIVCYRYKDGHVNILTGSQNRLTNDPNLVRQYEAAFANLIRRELLMSSKSTAAGTTYTVTRAGRGLILGGQ